MGTKEVVYPIVGADRPSRDHSIAPPTDTGLSKFNATNITIFSDEKGSMDVASWVFLIENSLAIAGCQPGLASWIAFQRSSGTARIFINIHMRKSGAMKLVDWAVLKPALLKRFGNLNPESLRNQWLALKCGPANGRGDPSPADVEAYWDNFNDLWDKIKCGTNLEHHPSPAEVRRQFLRGIPTWDEELSRWISLNPRADLEAIKDNAVMLAEARERISAIRKEKGPETMAAVTSMEGNTRSNGKPVTTGNRNRESDNRPNPDSGKYRDRKNEAKEDPKQRNGSKDDGKQRSEHRKGNLPQSYQCFRCGKDVGKGAQCACENTPQCTRCGGLHLTNFHDVARAAYLNVCERKRSKAHDRYDREPSQNKGWFEKEVYRRNTLRIANAQNAEEK
jgi:hypothetical protein